MFRTTIETTDVEELERILRFIQLHLPSGGLLAERFWDVRVRFDYRLLDETDKIEWYPRYVLSVPKKWLRNQQNRDLIEAVKAGEYDEED